MPNEFSELAGQHYETSSLTPSIAKDTNIGVHPAFFLKVRPYQDCVLKNEPEKHSDLLQAMNFP